MDFEAILGDCPFGDCFNQVGRDFDFLLFFLRQGCSSVNSRSGFISMADLLVHVFSHGYRCGKEGITEAHDEDNTNKTQGGVCYETELPTCQIGFEVDCDSRSRDPFPLVISHLYRLHFSTVVL
jgi:hypothetical protein